jgi:hypothetical protein
VISITEIVHQQDYVKDVTENSSKDVSSSQEFRAYDRQDNTDATDDDRRRQVTCGGRSGRGGGGRGGSFGGSGDREARYSEGDFITEVAAADFPVLPSSSRPPYQIAAAARLEMGAPCEVPLSQTALPHFEAPTVPVAADFPALPPSSRPIAARREMAPSEVGHYASRAAASASSASATASRNVPSSETLPGGTVGLGDFQFKIKPSKNQTKSWTCACCTFVNDPQMSYCEMCESKR